MQRTPIQSSSIASVGYDPDAQMLHVEFNSGKVYEYEGVAPNEHAALMEADSVGRHFGAHIRPHYEGRAIS